ncbi:MAG: hypothetical protein KGZ25_14935 [Planctomycetes bacterium]|nr:hypothetical protein [Planctomycetota bacterium]
MSATAHKRTAEERGCKSEVRGQIARLPAPPCGGQTAEPLKGTHYEPDNDLAAFTITLERAIDREVLVVDRFSGP